MSSFETMSSIELRAVLASDSFSYAPALPRSISLNSCAGDADGPHVEFTADVEVGVGPMLASGDVTGVCSKPMPLYHSHVLWSYALLIRRKSAATGPDKFALSLYSCGPHIGIDITDAGSRFRNKSTKQKDPVPLLSTVTILDKNKQEGETLSFSYCFENNSYYINLVKKELTEQELRSFVVGDTVHARLRITVDRKYFDWKSYVDWPFCSNATKDLTEGIFRGEKPDGADWIIATNAVIEKGEVVYPATSFHVHREKLASASAQFKRAFSTDRSIPGVIEMVKGENKCILSACTNKDAQLIISISYGAPPYLPCDAEELKSNVSACNRFFPSEIFTDVVCPAWERKACETVTCSDFLTLQDEHFRRFLTKTCLEMVYLCPLGSMPVARRVLIGALADRLHLDVDSGSNMVLMVGEWLLAMGVTEDAIGASGSPMNSVKKSLTKFFLRVSKVHKKGVQLYATEKMSERFKPVIPKLIEHAITEQAPPLIPHTRSLDSCEGDQTGDRIEFSRDQGFSLKTEFTQMPKTGDGIQSLPIPLTFNHVLWSFGMRWKRVEDDSYELSLASVGPHITSHNGKRPDPDTNCPKGLEEPRILSATLTFLGGSKEEIQTVKLPPSLIAPKRFSMAELIGLAVDDELKMRVTIVIDRSYFSLATIIDLDAKPTVFGRLQDQVDMILRGERPPGSDWEITVPKEQSGQGDASSPHSSYHVHISAIENASPAIKRVIETGRPFVSLVQPGTNSCLLAKFTPDDMKVVIPLIYGTEVPLPEKNEKRLVDNLRMLFKADLLTEALFPQWERAICKKALALDKTTTPSLASINHLLSIVYNCPFGSMPVAKRVVVGVFADMVHQQSRGDWFGFTRELSAAANGNTTHLLQQASMLSYLRSVGLVKKTLMPASDAATVPHPTVPHPGTLPAHKDVVIELAEEEEEDWHDAESINNQPDTARQSCTIS